MKVRVCNSKSCCTSWEFQTKGCLFDTRQYNRTVESTTLTQMDNCTKFSFYYQTELHLDVKFARETCESSDVTTVYMYIHQRVM